MGAVLFATLNLLQAAPLTASTALTSEEVSTMVEAVAQTTPTPASQVPDNGRYYSAKTPDGPPMPGNMNFPAWNLGDNVWLLDDLKPATTSSRSMTAMDISLPTDGGDDGDTNGGSYTPNLSGYVPPNTNGLWLELTNYDGNWAYLNLHNGTNQVYAIWSTTNLPGGWQVETELWPVGVETNVFPFTVTALNRPNLFLRAEDWTGVDSNGDGIPDWWIWMYFGNLSETSTNLDANGNTLGYDYTNHVTPLLFQFYGISVTNNYVNTLTPSVQLVVTGSPYYVATLVDDTNYNDAQWNPYGSSNVTVNLGFTQGWHDVWIGLRGHGDDPMSAVWQYKHLNLDYTPPALFITSPTNGTVNIPTIQLTGFSPEALSSINYDLTNATGLVTNQQVLITDQFYDVNLAEFTTNTFQGFDIPLTNGLNTFTLHATDLAGNVATLVTNITLDYSSKTNPPTVQISWPANGDNLSGNSFNLGGQVSDPTASVSAQLDSTTNPVSGAVGRDGTFWLQNLPLHSGTNTVSLTVQDVVGNTTTTNLTLIQSPVVLTINPVVAGQVTVTGSISQTGYTVWVNNVQATLSGTNWTVQIPPITIGGGSVRAAAVPSSGGPTNQTQSLVPAPQGVFLDSYHLHQVVTSGLTPSTATNLWKVSSYAISNFYVSTDAWHTNGYATPLTKTTNSGINFYWVDGGSKQVQCAIKAAGQTLLAKAAFIVKKPSATLSAYIPPGSSVGVYQNQLIFGGGPVPGIEFFEYNEDTDGEWKLVQLGSQVVRDQDFPTNGGGWYKAQGSGLDTAYPYPIEEESDSPSTELTSYINQVTATGSYTMYLTFKANEANSIRIPIRQIQWNWSGTATNSNGVWMGSGTAHTDSNDSPAPSIISWTDNIKRTLNNYQPDP